MNEIANISLKELTEKLVGLPYAFASWKMPNAEETVFIVSLNEAAQESTPLSTLSAGFVFNRFVDNHPSLPYHIPADLTFRGSTMNVANHISSDQVDEFMESLKANEGTVSDKKRSRTKNETDEFEKLVSRAIDSISAGEFDKVVLARFEDQQLPEAFSLTDFFKRICEKYSNAFVSMVHLPGEGIWIGASPELLISDNGQEFRTIALAGTKALLPNQKLTEIAWTQKEIEEQAFVSRYIINCFKKLRLREYEEKGPKTAQAGSLVHLKTEYIVDYSGLGFDHLAEEMLELLHPTSAVCGMPLAPAQAFIEKNENFDRGFYSGFLGPVNFDGSTDLYVNLRCANIEGTRIRYFAGAGITEDSNPVHEREETVLKMSVLKQLIN
jgi:isochorismate synthase